MDTAKVTAISQYIRENQSTPFEWGVFDCCVFASHIVKLQTGLDLYEPYRGIYSSKKASIKALATIGTIESQLDKHFDRIDPSLAQRGDIHMLASGVMAVQFSGHIWATSENGVGVTQEDTNICWRIA